MRYGKFSASIPPLYLSVLALSILLLSPISTRAEQWFFSDPLTWDARFTFDGRWRDTEVSPGNTQGSSEVRHREQISLRKKMHFLDPGLATLSLNVRPIMGQNDYDYIDGTTSQNDIETWNYGATASFLHGAKVPVSMVFGVDRNSGTTDGALGSRTDYDAKNEQVTLNIKNTLFPSYIAISKREQDLVQESGFLTTPVYTHDKIDRKIYRGHNNNTTLSIEELEYKDLVKDPVYDRDYTYQRQSLSNTLSWGKGSHANTSVDHTKQKDFGAYERSMFNENIKLQHTERFHTSYLYNYNKTEQILETIATKGYADINYRLYTNLNTKLGYQKLVSDYSPYGESTTSGPSYGISYIKKLPWDNSSISFGGSGSRLTTDTEIKTTLQIYVNQQNFEVPPSGTITLPVKYVLTVPATLITVYQIGGSILTLGSDYTISTIGDYTEITLTPAAAAANSSVNISYYFLLTPQTISFDSTQNSQYLNFVYNNVLVYFNQSRSNQSNISFGLSPYTETETKDSRIGFQYNLHRNRFTLGFGLDSHHTQLDEYSSRTKSAKQSLDYRFSTLVNLLLSAAESESSTTISEVTSFNADASLRIRVPASNLTIRPHTSYWHQENNLGTDDRYLNAGVGLDWVYHLITLNASYDNNQWSGTTRSDEENRVMFTVIRRSK
ncbi:MAG: hypothetical protein OEY67_00815 [Gammaproteobacteria bacterium]|nr:hypothetical protein [Gammaproteobacteria bacterium]